MPATFVRTCPLCGLRFSNTSLLELHVREDHRRRRGPAQDGGSSPGTTGPGGRAGGGAEHAG